jgi:hypothetical protein
MLRNVFLRVRKEGGGDVPALASSLHMLESVVCRMVRLKAWRPRTPPAPFGAGEKRAVALFERDAAVFALGSL